MDAEQDNDLEPSLPLLSHVCSLCQDPHHTQGDDHDPPTLKVSMAISITTPLNFFQGSSWLQDAEWLFAYRRWFQMSLKLLPNCENFSIGGSTVLAMAESVECFPIPVPCHILKVCSPNTHALSFSSHCSFLTLLIPVGMLLRSWWWWFVRSFTRPIVWWPAHT